MYLYIYILQILKSHKKMNKAVARFDDIEIKKGTFTILDI